MINEAERTSTAGTVMERPQIVVASDGTGDHRTITEAVAAASPGATIKIRPGVYEEALILEKPVTLSGDQNGLVLIQNGNFTAVTVRQTEVIMENLALGIVQVVLVADGSKVRMKDCVVALGVDLFQNCESTAAAIAQEDSPVLKGVPSVQAGVYNAVVLKSGSSLLLSRCLFHQAAVQSVNAHIGARSTRFDTSPLSISEKATLEMSECTIECSNLNPAISMTSDSTATLTATRLTGVSGVAIRCEASQLMLQDCDLHGTATLPYDDISGLPDAIQCGKNAPLKLIRTNVHGFRSAVTSRSITVERSTFSSNAFALSLSEEEDGRIDIKDSRFESNRSHGVHISCGGLRKRSHILWISGCEFVGNGIAVSVNNWGRKNQGGVGGCTFAGNGENIRANTRFLFKSVKDCKGFGESVAFKIAKVIRRLLPF